MGTTYDALTREQLAALDEQLAQLRPLTDDELADLAEVIVANRLHA